MTGGKCTRCGEAIIHGATDRFQLRAWDFTESSAAFFNGCLCTACWNDLLQFMEGNPTNSGGASA